MDQNSAILNLYNCVNKLYTNNLENTELGLAAGAAGSISYLFKEKNQDLSNGWNTVENFCDKIDKTVSSNLTDYIDSIRAFCKSTDYNEQLYWASVLRIKGLLDDVERELHHGLDSANVWYNGGIGARGRDIIG